MVNYRCKKGDIELEAVGDLADLSADVVMLVNLIYKKLNAKDSKMAFDFLDYVVHGIKYVSKRS